jgi:hypothetical protein
MANAVTLGVALELPFQLLFGAWWLLACLPADDR